MHTPPPATPQGRSARAPGRSVAARLALGLLTLILTTGIGGTPRAAGPSSILIISDTTTPPGVTKAYRAEIDQLLSAKTPKVSLTEAQVTSTDDLKALLKDGPKAKPGLIVSLGTTTSMTLGAMATASDAPNLPPVIALGWTTRGRPQAPPKGWALGWTHDLTRADSSLSSLLAGDSSAATIIADPNALPGTSAIVAPPSSANGSALAAYTRKKVILGPIPAMTPTQRQSLALALTRAGAYVYDAIAPETAETGAALAAVSMSPDEAKLTRWAALETLRAVEGRGPSAPVSDLRGNDRSVINLVVATQLRLEVSWEQLGQARVVTQGTTDGGLTLTQAVTQALKTSLQLKSSQLAVGAADADVQAALGRLLPQLSASLGGTLIESDSARVAQGANPQFTMDFDLSLSQLLYSEQVWTGYEVSKLSRKAAQHDRATTLLDVAQSVSAAWIQAQRAAAVVTIQRELLETSRANLRLAEGRIRAGQSTESERLRWESQIASDTAGVMDAVLNANLARLQLARAMGVNPAKPPTLATVALSTLASENGSELLASAGDSNKTVRALEKRLLQQALVQDPELARLTTLKRAQKRLAAGTTREMFIPTISVQAGLSARVAEAGAGLPGATLPGAPTEPSLFVGFKVSLPLFDGTTRYANLTKTRTEAMRLDVAIEARKQTVTGELMAAFRRTTIALAKVRVQARAAETARQSADLTAGAYKRGSTGIAPVLDAQSQVNRAALALIDAQFGVEEAIIGLYRQVGAFYFLLNADEKARWQATLQAAAKTVTKPTNNPPTPDAPTGSQP